MARRAVIGCVLLVVSWVLFSADAFSQTGECGHAAGQWEFRVLGRDCKGYQEEGKFVMTIGADCNLKIDILSDIPYAEKYLVTHKSLVVEKDRFYATVDFTVDACRTVVLQGKILEGKRIEGTYRYEDGGSGTFKAVKKKPAPRQPKADTDGTRSPDPQGKPLLRW
jgi:hypothetical protein